MRNFTIYLKDKSVYNVKETNEIKAMKNLCESHNILMTNIVKIDSRK